MNTTSQKSRFHILTLDNIGGTAVLAAAVLIVASGAFSALTDSTVPSLQAARQDQNRPIVAATQTPAAPQRVLATPTAARPMIVAANR